MDASEAERQLLQAAGDGGLDTHRAAVLYDSFEPVTLEELPGTWRGRELPTGHPLDGVLTALRWYGKAFHDADNVDPLLFEGAGGDVFAVDPVPILDLRKLVKAKGGKARMRMMEHRGKSTGTMIYDHLPIHDHFRKVNTTTLMGWMDWKGKTPFFFLLEKERSE